MIRISIRRQAAEIYHDLRSGLSPFKRIATVEIWEFLVLLQEEVVRMDVPAGKRVTKQFRLPGGCIVKLTFVRPRPSDADAAFDLALTKIQFPDELN